MVKGRVKSARHVRRSSRHTVKGRSKTSERKEIVKKATGRSTRAGNISVEHVSTAVRTTPIPRAISPEELNQLSHVLQCLRSDTQGMSVLANQLDPGQRKDLVDLLSHETVAGTKETKFRNQLKQSETLLRAIHSRERNVFDAVHGVLVLLDPDLTVRMLGKSGSSLLGFTEAELVGKNWLTEVVPKNHRAAVQSILDQVLNGTLADEYEYPVATKTGEERAISWHTGVLRDGTGAVTGMVCAGEDLTMLRQINAALARSEERLHLMMDSVGEDEFFITDPDGYVVSWIARSKDGKSYRAEEMVGKHFSCLYSPEDFQAGKPMRILETAQNAGRYEEDGWRIRKDGTRSRAYVIVTAIKDTERHLLGFSSVTRYVVEAAEAHAKRLFPFAVPVAEYP